MVLSLIGLGHAEGERDRHAGGREQVDAVSGLGAAFGGVLLSGDGV